MNIPKHFISRPDFAAPNLITTLKTKGQKLMAKSFTMKNGNITVIPYDKAMYFSAHPNTVNNTNDLLSLIDTQCSKPDEAIIFGAVLKEANPNHMRRLLHDKPNAIRTICDKGRLIVVLDYDGKKPAGAPDLLDDLIGAAKTIILRFLPPQMHRGTFVVQLGASAGVFPDKFSLHIWFIVDEPIYSHELSAFCRLHGFDPSVASPSQPIYTANPIFIDMEDPVKKRIGVIHGDGIVSAKTIKEAPKILKAKQMSRHSYRSKSRHHSHSTSGARRYSPYKFLIEENPHLVRGQGYNGWVHCDCPIHNSSSHKSLHVNIQTGQWHCHGCNMGGGSVYSLSRFLNHNSRRRS